MKTACLALYLFCLLTLTPFAASAVNYTVQDLGLYPGCVTTWAWDINEAGQIVGFAETPDTFRYPVVWDTKGNISRIGDLVGGDGCAEAINNSGRIVGNAGVPFCWTKKKGVVPYGYGFSCGCATDVNDAGWCVGSNGDLIWPPQACLWDPDGNPTIIGALPGDSLSLAYGINNSRAVVGSSCDSSYNERAFLWTPHRGMTELTAFGGRSWASDINNSGKIAGMCTVGYEYHACVWDANGNITDIGGDYMFSSAGAINDSGTIAGHTANSQSWVPLVWDAKTHVSAELPLLPGAIGGEAIGMNNAGRIVGYCIYSASNGYYSHAVVWNPEKKVRP